MRKVVIIILLITPVIGFTQTEITGRITDNYDNPLSGVNIIEIGTNDGTLSDFEGLYKISVAENAVLEFSSVGFKTQKVTVGSQQVINVKMADGVSLDQVVLVGSRTAARSVVDNALPIDNISAKELASSGQLTFDQALQYKIPSFNTTNTPVSDATSLLDPYEIRNLGPSRTLILINGKRKNLSALVYTYGLAGRGETGSDISGIPIDAIKRIEVLRDGASAQYGSGAISGVVNIVLKDSPNDGAGILRTGISSEGDGEYLGISLNNGASIFNDSGFINYTVDFSKSNRANRPGKVNAAGEISDFTDQSPEEITYVNQFLARYPDAKNINGSPENATAKFLINGGVSLSDNVKMYFNTQYAYKSLSSFANYRVPYWRTLEEFPYLADFFPSSESPNGYDGYVPTFDGILNDYHGTIGFKTEKNGWTYDVSYTTGGNSQRYTVRNSHNRNYVYSPSTWIDANNNGVIDEGEVTEGVSLYREKSQLNFNSGGAKFTHNVGNLDITKTLSEKVSIAFGGEFRNENFEIIAGELASYDGGGADSYAGSSPDNAGTFNRYNFGGYIDASFDINERFLLNGAARVETYSDFGEAFVWKLSSRYKLGAGITLRGSASTGFRAPTLHQIYSQKLQYSFVAGQGLLVTGLINNVSPQARFLGIPKLDSEKSTNFTFGVGAKISKNFSATVDYYNIAIKDRVVLGTDIKGTEFDDNGINIGTTPLDDILRSNSLNSVSFFINALDTRTSGLDVVLNYKNIGIGRGSLGLNLSGNYTIENKREGAIKNPEVIESGGQSVFDESLEATLFNSRPKSKWILGTDYRLNDFYFTFNNTYFGKAYFKDPGLNTNLRAEFIPKIVTDFGITYDVSDQLALTLNVNNLLNILPEWELKGENAAGDALLNDSTTNSVGLNPSEVQSNLITFNQRYAQTTYFGYHFDQFGTNFNLMLQYSF